MVYHFDPVEKLDKKVGLIYSSYSSIFNMVMLKRWLSNLAGITNKTTFWVVLFLFSGAGGTRTQYSNSLLITLVRMLIIYAHRIGVFFKIKLFL